MAVILMGYRNNSTPLNFFGLRLQLKMKPPRISKSIDDFTKQNTNQTSIENIEIGGV